MWGESKVFAPAAVIGMISLVLLLTVKARDGQAQMSDATASDTPSPTMILSLSSSPTPFVMQDMTANQRCVPVSGEEGTPPYGAIDALVHLLNSQPLLDFFNNGGTTETLRTTLNASGNAVGPYLSQVVELDVTDDAIPEIFLAITDAITAADYGESHLLMFQCVDGVYQDMILFQRAGAGSRAEGLYIGGGAHILSVADLNANGAMDVMFEVDWSDSYGAYSEYYVLEWQDDDFHSIVEYQNNLGDTRSFIQSNTIGDVTLVDLDDDGLYELVVDDIPYRWDGESYRVDQISD